MHAGHGTGAQLTPRRPRRAQLAQRQIDDVIALSRRRRDRHRGRGGARLEDLELVGSERRSQRTACEREPHQSKHADRSAELGHLPRLSTFRAVRSGSAVVTLITTGGGRWAQASGELAVEVPMRRVLLLASLLALTGCPASSSNDGGVDAPVMDAPSSDTGASDTGSSDTSGLDTPLADVFYPDAPTADVPSGLDAGPRCGVSMGGSCEDGALACSCCPAGGPTMHCVCSTPCTTDADCTDAARPTCQHAPGEAGFCAPADFTCCWLCL